MGWALGNVLYDKHPGLPSPNSPLESLFMLISLRRMESELLSTRAIVHASITSESQTEPIIKAFQEYADKTLPFLANAQNLEQQAEKDALLRFTKIKAKINKTELYRKKAALLRKSAAPSKFKLQPRTPGL